MIKRYNKRKITIKHSVKNQDDLLFVKINDQNF